MTVEFPVYIDCTYQQEKYGEEGVARHGYAVDAPFIDTPRQARTYYSRRFGIESSYRLSERSLTSTTTQNPVVRFLYVLLSFLLQNAWRYLHWEYVASPHRGARRLWSWTFKEFLGMVRRAAETALAVRLHATGLSLRETAAVLECFGVSRSHQAIWQWVHRHADSVPDPPTAQPSRVAVNETAVQVGTDWYWLYAAIDLDSKLLLGVRLSQRRRTTPAAAFLADLKAHHDLSDAYFLVDGYGYLTVLACTDLHGDLEYVHRNKIEK